MERISIIIPAYNEEKRIGRTLQAYGTFFNMLKKEKKIDYELLIVINNTKDKTEEIVKKNQRANKNIRYLNLVKGGKGYAIIEGFKDALSRKNDLIGFVDADLATSPEAYYDLIKNINNFDGIMGSRYIPGAKVSPKQSLKRIVASRIFNTIIRILFFMKYRDTQCGAKIFRRNAIRLAIENIGTTQWAFDVELLYLLRKSGLKIKEYPTIWKDNKYSKVEFTKDGPKMVVDVLKLRLKNSIFKNILYGK